MLNTTELRWFYPGILPREIQAWFSGDTLGEYLAQSEEREDVYLYLPDCEYLGIKWRQKRLEIKLRKAELGILRFGDNIAGKAEKWVKWACEDPSTASLLPADVVKQAPWLKIKKVRSQRKYQIGGDRLLTPVPIDTSIIQGCNVEITQLWIKDNPWWTLAFEALGEDTNLEDNLKIIANFVLQNYPNLKLLVDNSYGYPLWLKYANRK